jgi:6-pyruvoyltetrahydropterin/6-carboxytetrahydropterin synthase
MYELGVTAQFEAAHRLIGDFGPATRMHGHTYRLDATIRGRELLADGTLCDLSRFRTAVDTLAGALNYRELGEVPALAGVNTTVEALANYCWEMLAPYLQDQGLDSLRVQVWESPQVYAARDDSLSSQT